MTKKTVSTEVLANDLEYLKKGIDEIREELKCIRNEKVSRERFDLVNAEQNKRISNVEKLVLGAGGLTTDEHNKLMGLKNASLVLDDGTVI